LGLLDTQWLMQIAMHLGMSLKLLGSKLKRGSVDQMENKGMIKTVEQYIFWVCGRNFYTNEKFVNHFEQIHEHELVKRLN